jgi:AcrR family transcriptional regulator
VPGWSDDSRIIYHPVQKREHRIDVQVKKTSRRKGRPRSFDTSKALDRALDVFWRKGYEGASLSDLTHAMGINRPSLYAAFGDKETLFRKALDRYTSGPGAYVTEALDEPTAHGAIERLLRTASDSLTCPGQPRGCLMVQGALSCGEEAESVRKELIMRRGQGEAAIRRRLQRAKAEGELPANANPADLARFFAAVIHGMCIKATSGATRAELHRIVDTALQVWPK